MKKIDGATLRDKNLYQKGIMNVRKLRQIPRNILGFFFWQDVDSSHAIKQFSTINTKFVDNNDVINY